MNDSWGYYYSSKKGYNFIRRLLISIDVSFSLISFFEFSFEIRFSSRLIISLSVVN